MDSQDLLKISADNEIHKKHKKRTKKIKAQLQEQVEFYFGNANLQKDRFMKQEISKHPDGFVAISTIASFNRMKQITDDMSLVVKAMKMSSMLEVSEDDTMVRRTTPVPEPRNVDAETIYIERLPPYADHDWLKEIFSKYGKVVYISIPRFKHTGDVKGFAFVEFETAKEAQEAVEMFNKEGKQKQANEPEEKNENGLRTEQSSEQHKMVKGKRKRSHSESEVEIQKHKERKRKRTTSESSVDSGETEEQADTSKSSDIKQKHKESKNSEEGNERHKNGKEGPNSEHDGKDKKGKKIVRWQEGDKDKHTVTEGSGLKARKRSHADSADDDENVEQKRKKMSGKSELNSKNDAEKSVEEETANDGKKHKKRKRKKKEKKETRLPHLRVISKLEWLELKKEYKNLQREAMNKLKKQLHEKPSADSRQAGHQAKKKSQDQVDLSKKKNQNKSSQEGDQVVKDLPYTPGVVLRFNCQSHGITKKELKDKFSSHAPVAYLDLTEGSVEGYVRFHTADKCCAVFETMSSTNDELQLRKLTEEDEKAYWEKINADRVTRYNAKRGKKRGTEKVARKAEALQVQRQSHIRFDDSEGEAET